MDTEQDNRPTEPKEPHPEFFFRAYHLGKDYLTEEEKKEIFALMDLEDDFIEFDNDDDDDDYDDDDEEGELEREMRYYDLYEVIVKARTPEHAVEIFKKFYPASNEEKQKLQTEYKIIETKYESFDDVDVNFYERECWADYQDMASDLKDEDFYSRGYDEWDGSGKEAWETNDEDYDESIYTLEDDFEGVPISFVEPALLPYLTEEQRASLAST